MEFELSQHRGCPSPEKRKKRNDEPFRLCRFRRLIWKHRFHCAVSLPLSPFTRGKVEKRFAVNEETKPFPRPWTHRSSNKTNRRKSSISSNTVVLSSFPRPRSERGSWSERRVLTSAAMGIGLLRESPYEEKDRADSKWAR